MQRLVTREDLEKYPHLRHKGVSMNTHYDFSQEEKNAENTAVHQEVNDKIKHLANELGITDNSKSPEVKSTDKTKEVPPKKAPVKAAKKTSKKTKK